MANDSVANLALAAAGRTFYTSRIFIDDQAGLRTELIQTAAVAIAWLEAIDKRNEAD